jgi:hypothetical protein
MITGNVYRALALKPKTDFGNMPEKLANLGQLLGWDGPRGLILNSHLDSGPPSDPGPVTTMGDDYFL